MSMNYEPTWPWRRPDLAIDLRRSWLLRIDMKRKPWWLFRPYAENRITLEHHALKYVPEPRDLDCFEALDWRARQIVLARLRRLESEVNLKPLSIPLALFSAVIVLMGIQLRVLSGDPTSDPNADPGLFWVVMAVLFALLLVIGIALGIAISIHQRKESCLSAWTEALTDSHTLQTKIEEESRKAKSEPKSYTRGSRRNVIRHTPRIYKARLWELTSAPVTSAP